MADKKVGLGLIGCGFGSQALYGSFFKYLENGELVGVTDIDEKRAKECAQMSGARKIYKDYREMVADPEVDAVLILTPPFAHLEPVIAAAKAGKHVYCEKPMARTVSEAQAIIDVCCQNGVKLQTAFMKRANLSFLKVKSLLDEGVIGQVFSMRAIWDNCRSKLDAKNGYRLNAISGGGFLQEDGSHPLDVIHWWLGEVEEVSGYVQIVDPNRWDSEDTAVVSMKHKNGCISTLHITLLTQRTGMESYEVFGTGGTLLMQWPYHSTKTLEPAIIRVFKGSDTVKDYTLYTSWNPQVELEASWQYLRELRSFCNCILTDTDPEVPGEAGRAVVEIINAAYISADENRKVPLPLDKDPDFDKIFGRLRRETPFRIKDEEICWSRY